MFIRANSKGDIQMAIHGHSNGDDILICILREEKTIEK
jgi:hypothetical protein